MIDIEQRRDQLMQRVRANPADGEAWHHLAKLLDDPQKQEECRKLAKAAGYVPLSEPQTESPRPPQTPARAICEHAGCDVVVTKPGHKLCYAHWKAVRLARTVKPHAQSSTSGKERRAVSKQASVSIIAESGAPYGTNLLTVSTLAERASFPAWQINNVFQELGWIAREQKGWIAQPRALALGAVQTTFPRSQVPYVLWPPGVLDHPLVRASIKEDNDNKAEPHVAPNNQAGFREQFRAQHRAMDGHWVRSKAELLIDNWLYMSGIVHAYERRVPIDEELYCDFYLPATKVYIEYWGIENDQRYAARKQTKLELYRRYELQLVELTDDDIRNLDDVLPKLLRRYNISVI